jgi:hypothetical protein
MNRLFGKRLRPRVAIGWVILPWKEDHSPVIRELLILRYLKRLLDDVPKVTATAPPRHVVSTTTVPSADGSIFLITDSRSTDLELPTQSALHGVKLLYA